MSDRESRQAALLRAHAAVHDCTAAYLRIQAATIEFGVAAEGLARVVRSGQRRSWDLYHYAPMGDRILEGDDGSP